MKRWTPSLVLLITLYSFGWGATAVAADDTQAKLKEIEARIKQASRSLAEKKAAEKDLKKDLRTVEQAVDQLQSKLQRQQQRLKKIEEESKQTKAEADKAESHLKQMEGQVRKRLVAWYKDGEVGFLKVLFSGQSPVIIAQNYDFMGKIIREDRVAITSYRNELKRLEKLNGHLTSLHADQQNVIKDLETDRRQLTQAAALKSQLLSQVRREEKDLSRTLSDLKKRAAALSDLVKKLESEKTAEYNQTSAPFAQQKGRLPWPIKGKVRIGFGKGTHPDLGTTYDSQGIEIQVDGKQTFKAVWAGKVIFAKWFKGYGNLLILDHGNNFYTVYAQASRLIKGVGDVVRQGDSLGETGQEGPSGLYFEIRHRGTPLDPKPWLASH